MSKPLFLTVIPICIAAVFIYVSKAPEIDPNAPDPDFLKKMMMRNSQDIEFLQAKIDSLQAMLANQVARGSGVESTATVGYSAEATAALVESPDSSNDVDVKIPEPVDWPNMLEEPEVRQQFQQAVYSWIDKKRKDEARTGLNNIWAWIYAVDINSTPKKLKLGDIQKQDYARVMKAEQEAIKRISDQRYASVDNDGKKYKAKNFNLMEYAARKKTMDEMKTFMDPGQFKKFQKMRAVALKNHNKNKAKRNTEIGRLSLEAQGK